jgi:hypothetical protein
VVLHTSQHITNCWACTYCWRLLCDGRHVDSCLDSATSTC